MTFVWLGKRFPNYGSAALQLARRYSGMSVRLLCSRAAASQRNFRAQLRGVDVRVVEDFYNPDQFAASRKAIESPESFRQGFWLKTFERMFVIQQFMRAHNEPVLFHSELDQILFDAPALLRTLPTGGAVGLNYPLHTRELGVASILYVNRVEALEELLSFAASGRRFQHEMELLGQFQAMHPEYAFPIPTLGDVVGMGSAAAFPSTAASAEIVGAIADAAQVGLWTAGQDPRNLPMRSRPESHFAQSRDKRLLTREQLEHLRASWDRDCQKFTLKMQGLAWTIHNIHLHAKIHKVLLAAEEPPEILVRAINSPTPVVFAGQKRQQALGRLSDGFGRIRHHPVPALRALGRHFVRGILRALRLRPVSRPRISGDDFRALADVVVESSLPIDLAARERPVSIVFCQSDMFETFKKLHADQQSAQCVLILGNGDRNFIASDFDGLDRTRIVAIFSQNLAQQTPVADVLPIGLENRSYFQNNPFGAFSQYTQRNVAPSRRIPRIMWSFTVSNNPDKRTRALRMLRAVEAADSLGIVSPEAHRAALRRYCFVASPEGNGIDCHRTWEALYSGCVPIVLRSHMTDRYWDLGLPVLVVDDYSELASVGERQLAELYVKLQHRFDSPALFLPYWANKIRSKAHNQSHQ